jgi:hypothetical protein
MIIRKPDRPILGCSLYSELVWFLNGQILKCNCQFGDYYLHIQKMLGFQIATVLVQYSDDHLNIRNFRKTTPLRPVFK